MKVLVTDSNSRPALAITRSVAGAGHTVVTCGHVVPSLAGVSRFSHAHEATPDPSREPTRFEECVRDIVRRHRIDVLLPVTEVSTLMLLADPGLRQIGVRSPFPDAAVVAVAADKSHVIQLARDAGIPVPATMVAMHATDVDAGALDLPFPVVIKPARSRVRTPDGWIGTGVSYAEDAAALRRQLDALPREVFPVLLQERIEGRGVGVFLCLDGGRCVAVFAHQRLREMPPSGGVSVLCESSEPDPVALDHAECLLARIGWRGPAMVEFKRDDRDGSLRLMEINGRFWGSLQLAIDAGVDFPRIAVDVAAGNRVGPVERYDVGVRSRWFWGDASALLLLMTRSAKDLALPADHPGRWRTLMQFLRFFDARTRNEVLRRDDWRPFVLESRRWIGGK